MSDDSREMSESPREDHERLLSCVIAGLVQGGTFYFCLKVKGFSAPAAFTATFAAMAGTSFMLAHERGAGRFFLAPVLLFSLAFSLSAAWITAQPTASSGYIGKGFLLTLFAFGASLSWYAFLPFVQAAIGEKRFAFPYGRLFRHAWDNLLILCAAALTAGLFWALIGLWTALFNLLGVRFFSKIFLTEGFFLVATPAIFGAGVALARRREAILNSLRHIIFSICEFLAPMVSGIIFLFLAALVPMGLKPLWDTNMSALILLCAQGTVIFFLNAALQDRRTCPSLRPLRLAAEGAALVLPLFTALIAYALGLRINQYGLTPDRILAVAASVLLGVYALGYAAAVIMGLLRGGPWLGLARPVNKLAAWCIILASLLLLSPVLDPLSLSARNQFDRLISGKADPATFDFLALRKKYGPEGAALFSRLEDADILRDKLRLPPKLVEAIGRGVSRANHEEAAQESLQREEVAVAGGGVLPDGLFAALNEAKRTFSLWNDDKLHVIPLDLNGDGQDEFLTIDSNAWKLTLFARKADGGYEEAGSYGAQGISRQELLAAGQEGRIKPLKQLFEDLEVDGKRLPFSP